MCKNVRLNTSDIRIVFQKKAKKKLIYAKYTTRSVGLRSIDGDRVYCRAFTYLARRKTEEKYYLEYC